MLAADKLQLQSALKQQATALKEKEFNLHHSNMMTVGTQAAVLASLDVTMFIEFQPPHDSEWGEARLIPRALKFVYYIMITAAFCANILVVGQTTVLSVLGSALALRGPDGSMMTATDGLYNERKSVFWSFGFGLGATVGSVVLCVWLILSPEAAVVCMSITIFTAFQMYKNYLRVTGMFEFKEEDTVDFTDIFEGPAAIRAVPMQQKSWNHRGRKLRSRPELKRCSSDELEEGNYNNNDTTNTNTGMETAKQQQQQQQRNGQARRRALPFSDKTTEWAKDYDFEGGMMDATISSPQNGNASRQNSVSSNNRLLTV